MKLSEWKSNTFAPIESGLKDGKFISGQHFLICAGPPTLRSAGGTNIAALSLNDDLADSFAYPIGISQTFSLGQNIQQTVIPELGTNATYFITGRSVGQASIGRVYYSGINLLRALYAYYQNLAGVPIKALYNSIAATTGASSNTIFIDPGTANIFINLASDLFAQPIGLLFLMRTAQEETIGAFYLERCLVNGHQFGTDVNGLLIQESATLIFQRIVPVEIQAVKLMNTLKDTVSDMLG